MSQDKKSKDFKSMMQTKVQEAFSNYKGKVKETAAQSLIKKKKASSIQKLNLISTADSTQQQSPDKYTWIYIVGVLMFALIISCIAPKFRKALKSEDSTYDGYLKASRIVGKIK